MVDPTELDLDPFSEAELEAASNVVKRNVEILREFASRDQEGKPRVVRLRFQPHPSRSSERNAWRSGVRPQPPGVGRSRIGSCGRDRRAGRDPVRDRLPQRRLPRRRRVRGAVRRARRHDAQRRGRVLDEDGAPIRGLYCAGWIKRDTVLSGRTRRTRPRPSSSSSTMPALPERSDQCVDELLAARGVQIVTYQGWEAIDAVETSRGAEVGRPRIKLVTRDELLQAARNSSS